MNARDLEERNIHLDQAHIVYPAEPFTEVVDATNLTRSDVVLLCRPDHLLFDSDHPGLPSYTVDESAGGVLSAAPLDAGRVPRAG